MMLKGSNKETEKTLLSINKKLSKIVKTEKIIRKDLEEKHKKRKLKKMPTSPDNDIVVY